MSKKERQDENGHGNQHRQVKVFCPIIENTIEVDEGIAPLLLGLWEQDIFSLPSCTNFNGDRVWLNFDSSREIEIFLLWIVCFAKLNDTAPANIRERILGYLENQDGSTDEQNWKYIADSTDLNEGADGGGDVAGILPFNIAVSIDVGFPRSDYPFVLQAIEFAGKAKPCPHPPEDRGINSSPEPEG